MSATQQERSAEPVTLVVLGASGDLFARLLMPGLADLLAEQPERRIKLVGSGRSERSDEQWRAAVGEAIDEEARSREAEAYLLDRTEYVQADPTDKEQLEQLIGRAEGRLVLYFALPPAVTIAVCERLHELDLPEGLKIVAEKPFGTDADSARELNAALHTLVGEEDVHRVDHFLGMSSTLDLLGLRLSNRVFSQVWSNAHVERVDVVFDETLGLEGRAGFYDGTGALVDMIQSHLLQVLALVAMEPPARIDDLDLRDQIAHVLRSTSIWDDDPVGSSRRGRYTAGTVGDRELPSYVDEEDVDPSLETETYAEITCQVATERWAGVPFRLRSGKALAQNRRELRLTFRPPAHVPPGLDGPALPEVMVIDLKTGDLHLQLSTNASGDPFRLERSTLAAEVGSARMSPYGEVLRAALDGDARLSVRGDVAVRCWEIIAPVQRAWADGEVPLLDYPAGSEGPED
ncbi:glucose-6-phosphate dehydrogenase [Auraticoccus sp. F435]|uniref:Glucose-6-phosphate dehydrogenase n=1 Tax=Auraticoccus cholistanensis TaxID=2656650 RepID=A0A6A9UU41_9ACTN|nr:glucose-6-phosphate dehydrogenase [Auraticoccus cholistanensis]